MANDGNIFRDKIAEMIRSWDSDLEVLTEKHVGLRFVNTPRKLDVIVQNKRNGKTMAIEAKLQRTPGSAYEKLSYALDDCLASPIPTIIVFAGKAIRADMRSKLITSGIGVEIGYLLDDNNRICDIVDPLNLLRQRVYIALDMDWFPFATSGTLNEASYGDAYSE
ncbi:PD-(D/E)XK nuclease superfamily protein [Anaerovibrio lipolyticus]|uniref:PD-(D/E)XK nuclease superfamily protein n=1 Tax=Anaerovibrio lipolyticus TaxID=82374 RepID=UPI000489783D|nr:PD-(D/E)XK nuclease superfamily protein [Anaerovibrio lipolyticus]